MRRSSMSSGGRYPVLRSLAILYLIGACLSALGGIVTATWVLARAPDTADHRIGLALSVLAATFFVVLTMLAIAEVLKLFIDLEHNSRMIAFRDATANMAGMANMAAADSAAPSNGGAAASSRMQWMQGEETAEAALLRGH